MTQYRLSVHVDLRGFKGGLQRSLQRATDMVAFGLWASENASGTDNHDFPGAFFTVSPGENVRLDFDGKKREFPGWVLANGLRDCVEAVHAFLEEARRICSLWTSLVHVDRMTGAEWNNWRRKEEAEASDFHAMGLPGKFDVLIGYSPILATPLRDHILTINRGRNCLVHRQGKVTSRDTNTPEGLMVRWLKMQLIARDLEGVE